LCISRKQYAERCPVQRSIDGLKQLSKSPIAVPMYSFPPRNKYKMFILFTHLLIFFYN